MTPVLAIDPGKHGALAVLAADGLDARVFDLPEDDRHLALLVRQQTPKVRGVRAVIEDVHGMPNWGNSFQFGVRVGRARMAFAAAELRPVLVQPVEWKHSFGLVGKDKSASLVAAREAFPRMAATLARERDHDRAEALLMALWLYRKGA